MRVPKAWLLVANGLIWGAAGVNILRLGIAALHRCVAASPDGGLAAADVVPVGNIGASGIAYGSLLLALLLAMAVFLAFHFMFTSIVRKNRSRIRECSADRMPLWQMMPLKSWLVLAFMMSLGISLKLTGLASDFFMSFFYTGLGAALAESGLRYIFFCKLTGNS